jgi:sulfatase maturation enzyme AslB (radical SAM superfamily)
MIDQVAARTGPDPVAPADDDLGVPLRRYCPGCGTWLRPGQEDGGHETVTLPARIWIYSNYDCNFSCTYCLAQSSPKAARRAVEPDVFRRIVDEADAMGFAELYITGGEPMLLPEMPEMLAYASARFPTVVLSNASLAHGARLERLRAVARDTLSLQVSLDGATAAANDAYRGVGTWDRTLRGIRNLIEAGIRVRLSTTETPANAHEIDAIRALAAELGVAPGDHFVRPLIRRGFSDEGLELERQTLVPELTIDRDGVYWHASATEDDLLVTEEIFPLRDAMDLIARGFRDGGGEQNARPFR